MQLLLKLILYKERLSTKSLTEIPPAVLKSQTSLTFHLTLFSNTAVPSIPKNIVEIRGNGKWEEMVIFRSQRQLFLI